MTPSEEVILSEFHCKQTLQKRQKRIDQFRGDCLDAYLTQEASDLFKEIQTPFGTFLTYRKPFFSFQTFQNPQISNLSSWNLPPGTTSMNPLTIITMRTLGISSTPTKVNGSFGVVLTALTYRAMEEIQRLNKSYNCTKTEVKMQECMKKIKLKVTKMMMGKRTWFQKGH